MSNGGMSGPCIRGSCNPPAEYCYAPQTEIGRRCAEGDNHAIRLMNTMLEADDTSFGLELDDFTHHGLDPARKQAAVWDTGQLWRELPRDDIGEPGLQRLVGASVDEREGPGSVRNPSQAVRRGDSRVSTAQDDDVHIDPLSGRGCPPSSCIPRPARLSSSPLFDPYHGVSRERRAPRARSATLRLRLCSEETRGQEGVTMTEAATRFEDKAQQYAHPEVLVSTDWVQEHLSDQGIRIAECDEDVLLYEVGHIPGAVKLDWHTDLQDPLRRDFLDRAGFEQLMASKGIANDTTVVLYGDKNNWYATYTFWLFKLLGHEDVRVMDGGRLKWEKENRSLTREVPLYDTTTYRAKEPDTSIRAFRDEVARQSQTHRPLIDVRSAAEYRGELIHMLDYPQEGAQRGGHIPGAKSIPWGTAANPDDGTFKTADELREIYQRQNGISADETVISYCRIGERSSHTWFLLKYLLGYPDVKNYDGSWTEWGNLVGAPIEK
jgi:thiosulfate/3-mercaptopyruvate sulfurtransferase